MKYLFVTRNKYPPFRADVKVLFHEELTALEHEIDWLMPSEDPSPHARRVSYGSGSAWVSASSPGNSNVAKARRLLQEFFNDLRVFRLLRRSAYDFVLVKDKFLAGALALLAARWRGTRYVFWLAYPFPEAWIYEARSRLGRYPAFSWLRGQLSRWLLYRCILPRADRIFVQSAQMLEDVAREGIDRERIRAVPMGVSTAFTAEHQTSADCAQARLPAASVVYVGTMIRVRRLEFLIDAFARVIERVPTATLYMIGGESEEDINRLRTHADSLGLGERVVFTGQMPQPEAIGAIAQASVCVSPFFPTPILNSTSPTKLVEYLSQGTPVVANEHPEQSKVIAESGGGLCVPWEEGAFADAIAELLENPERAREMGRAGRRYVLAERTYPIIAARVHKLLSDLVAP